MKIALVYQIDIGGVVTGGIDSVIRGVIKWLPNGLDVRIIGITTDKQARPVGEWTRVNVDSRSVLFFPVAYVDSNVVRRKIPLAVLMLFGLIKYFFYLYRLFDLFEFHRIDYALPFALAKAKCILVIHQNSADLKNGNSDIRWRIAPSLYYRLEDFLFRRVFKVYCVRSDAIEFYKNKYRDSQGKFCFYSTWVDYTIFFPLSEGDRKLARSKIRSSLSISDDSKVLITVGRLDNQKNHELMIRSFYEFSNRNSNSHLVIIGEGVLGDTLKKLSIGLGIESKVHFVGRKDPRDIAIYLNSADVFLLSSAYEGMPVCVLEAIATGLPVISTNVGEVSNIINNKYVGVVVNDFSIDSFSEAMYQFFQADKKFDFNMVVERSRMYFPERVLSNIYDNYREV